METCTCPPMLVGLCGRSGSGKGYTAQLFAEIGIPSIDTDAVYRKMTGPGMQNSPCMQDLRKRFGPSVVAEDGSLNRPVMRDLVFSGDRQALQDLNHITHHHILQQTREIARQMGKDGVEIILIDAPVLFESGFDAYCVRTICVTAPESSVLRRIMRRDNIPEEDARRRLAVQKSAAELAEKADFVLVNDCERSVLEARVRTCADELHKIRDAWIEKGGKL